MGIHRILSRISGGVVIQRLLWLQRPGISSLPRKVYLFILCLFSIFIFLAGPPFYGMYNLQRAGQLMEVGIVWPEPRLEDSLPTVQDAQAVEKALKYLDAARKGNPDDVQAYRLTGQLYAAQGKWGQAARAMEQARRHVPQSPLLAWETGLIYEQMWRAIEHAPRTALVASLSTEQFAVATDSVQILSCYTGQLSPYFVNRIGLKLPYTQPDSDLIRQEPTFYADSAITHKLTIPRDRPALTFLLGFDQNAPRRYSNRAIARIWVEPGNGDDQLLVAEYSLDPTIILEPWASGWVDLSPWVGQMVTLVIEVDNGYRDHLTSDDWYEWKDLALTSVEAAWYATFIPTERMRQVWQDADFNAGKFVTLGRQAQRSQQYGQGVIWLERAILMGAEIKSSLNYTHFLMLRDQDKLIQADIWLKQAVLIDEGWIDPELRFVAWFHWGQRLVARDRVVEAEAVLNKAVMLYPEHSPPYLQMVLSEVHRHLGLSHWAQGNMEQAAKNLREAVDLSNENVWANIHYGKIVYIRDSKQVAKTKHLFAHALELNSNNIMIWKDLISFWRWQGTHEEAEALCLQAVNVGHADTLLEECSN
jgi:tetratricopeptide (TPR) repeat protein